MKSLETTCEQARALRKDKLYLALLLACAVLGFGSSLYLYTRLLSARLQLDTWVRFGARAQAQRDFNQGKTNYISVADRPAAVAEQPMESDMIFIIEYNNELSRILATKRSR